ncbi:MAG: hypothetical protein ACSLEN_06295 [Candidatus Malihini olakiniferum]
MVEPVSDKYIAMFIIPRNMLYPFKLETYDNYLLTNLKPVSGVDIYLYYSLSQDDNGKAGIVSLIKSILYTRLKPLMINKRVLAIRSIKENKKEENVSQLLVELRDTGIKFLKGLEGKARILVFSTVKGTTDSRTEVNYELSDKSRLCG